MTISSFLWQFLVFYDNFSFSMTVPALLDGRQFYIPIYNQRYPWYDNKYMLRQYIYIFIYINICCNRLALWSGLKFLFCFYAQNCIAFTIFRLILERNWIQFCLNSNREILNKIRFCSIRQEIKFHFSPGLKIEKQIKEILFW